jgi:hypothetical protein
MNIKIKIRITSNFLRDKDYFIKLKLIPTLINLSNLSPELEKLDRVSEDLDIAPSKEKLNLMVLSNLLLLEQITSPWLISCMTNLTR